MDSSPTSSWPKAPATKRSISLVSTAGVEEVIQAIKYLKLRNAPSIRTASPPASTRTRTPNRRTRRSPRPTVNCRIATAFALPESEAFDSSVDDLADSMEMLHITVPFEQLPNEVLIKIFEQLGPTPVTPRGNTSLGSLGRMGQLEDSPPGSQDATGHWTEYLNGRNDIKSLCLVNKGIRSLATPLLYRCVLISQPKHLWALGRTFATDPSLALHVRHFNCAVNLEEAGTAVTSHVWELWRFPNHWTGDGIGAGHPYHRFANWFVQCEAVYSSRFILNRRAGQAFFCAILCLTNRVETLNLHLPNMLALSADPRLRSGSLSSLWKWFLDDTNPFAEFSKVIPMNVTAGWPTTPQLLERPCWPPPFLRNLTVEISPHNGACAPGSYVHLDVVPPIDAWQHAALLKLNGLALFDPVDLLRPCRLRNLSPAEMLCVTGYLDGLQRIPYIADSSDTMNTHLERLKHFDNYLSSPDYDQASAQGLARILSLLPAPGRWNSRLLTRSKALSLPMSALFLLDFGQLAPPSSISGLTFRYDVGDSCPRPRFGFVPRGCRLQTKLFGPKTCKAYMASLEELHLPLRHPTNLAGPASSGIDRLRLSSAETGSYLPRLKVLELTTEALFGSLLNMHRVFRGERFTRSSTLGSCDRSRFDDIPHTSAIVPNPSTRDLEAIVDELPPVLTELKLIEWWFHFSEPMIMPVRSTQRKPSVGEEEEGWPERYKHVQRAFVAGLRELAGVLRERRPSVNKVTVVVHSWTTARYLGEALDEDKWEAGQVWMSWAREKMVGLKALKRMFRDKGIVLKVAMAKEGSDVS